MALDSDIYISSYLKIETRLVSSGFEAVRLKFARVEEVLAEKFWWAFPFHEKDCQL